MPRCRSRCSTRLHVRHGTQNSKSTHQLIYKTPRLGVLIWGQQGGRAAAAVVSRLAQSRRVHKGLAVITYTAAPMSCMDGQRRGDRNHTGISLERRATTLVASVRSSARAASAIAPRSCPHRTSAVNTSVPSASTVTPPPSRPKSCSVSCGAVSPCIEIGCGNFENVVLCG